jgi:branched-subunit amino acid ABC-type transport system permease component
MTSNGHIPAFDLSRLSYGDLRRLQQLDPTTPEGQELLDVILARAVVGGLDAIPVTAITATISGLMAAITEAMSGKGQPAAPSSTGSGAAVPEVPST